MKTHKITFILSLFFLYIISLSANPIGGPVFAKGDSLFNAEEYQQARAQYEMAGQYFLANNQQDSILECIIQIAYTFIYEGNIQGMIDYVEIAISNLETNDDRAGFLLGKCYALLGYAQKTLLKYVNALEAYENALHIFEQINADNSNVAYTYRNAAQIYMRRLDYAKTIEYLKRGLKSDSSKTYEGTIYGLLAKTEHLLHNDDQALQYFNTGIKLPFEYPDEKAIISTIGADIYLEKGALDKAADLYLEALPGFTGLRNVWGPKMDIYLSLAKIASKQGQTDVAIQYFQKSLEESNIYPVKKRETAGLYADWGEFYLNQNEFDAALNYFQKALIQVIPNFNSLKLEDNPAKEALYPEPWIMTAAALKGKALRKRFDQSQNIQDLKIAGESYLLALATIDVLKSTYGTEKAKLYIGEYGNQYYEQAIEVFYQLRKQTGEMAYLDQVFQLMERSKAALLKEARQQHQAILLAAIPDSILQREEALRSDIAIIKKTLAFDKLKEAEKDQERIDELEAQLNRIEGEYSDFLTQLEDKYPKYKALNSNTSSPKMEIVRQELPGGKQAILEYFWGNESAYLIWVTKNEASVFQIENFQALSLDLEKLLSLLRQGNKLLESPDQFNALSYRLYRGLGFETLPLQSISKLLIIPDGQLHYLPFEVLLTQPAAMVNAFETNYLLKSHATSYAYTATDIVSESINSSSNRFLKIAPEFSMRERGLIPLKFSEQETGKLKPNVSIKAAAALSSYFKSKAGNFDLIHLSTHAVANPKDALPRIEFIDTALYLPEIYAMKLHANLVVLSACETGMGEFAKGEGVMSLARGFLFAGASSLVSSLWKVNERSTATIFGNFYNHLKSGMDKSEALREAKLQYLREAENDIQKSPYYWAGFTLTGEDGTVSIPNQSFAYAWLLFITGLGIILIFLGRKYWKKIGSFWVRDQKPEVIVG